MPSLRVYLKTKIKDDLLAESAADAEGYEDKAEDSMLRNDVAVRKAEALLAMVVAPQGQCGNTPKEAQWSAKGQSLSNIAGHGGWSPKSNEIFRGNRNLYCYGVQGTGD